MLKYDEKASKTDLYARIKLAPMNAIEREIALNALRDADLFANSVAAKAACIDCLPNLVRRRR